MEVTREHLVGLEMALELANDRAAWGMTNNLRDLIRLAEAAPTKSEAVMLVPIKPTAAMLETAVLYAQSTSIRDAYNMTHYMRGLWLKMLAAAPITTAQKEAK